MFREARAATRCDQEEANFLALNLAHEIVTKKSNVKQARRRYAGAMRDMKHAACKQGFLFAVPKASQGDPDEELVPGPPAAR